MNTTELRLTRGDTETYTLTFKDGSGVAYNITSWLVFFTLKKQHDVYDADADLQKMVSTHTDPTNGQTQITLLHTDTHSLDPGEYYYDIQVVTDASEVVTVMKGIFTLGWDTTRRTSTAGTAGTVV
jgi:hypothetical protein